MKKRIKEVRKTLGLSQEKFGMKLCVTKTAISKMELGTYNITDTMIKLICREFSINESWLRTGDGEMFIEPEEAFLEDIRQRLGLSPKKMAIVSAIQQFSDDEIDIVIRAAKAIVESTNKGIKTYDLFNSSTMAVADEKGKYRDE